MILVCSARGARWIIEQPEGSTLPNHPRFQELLSIVKETCHNSQCQKSKCSKFQSFAFAICLNTHSFKIEPVTFEQPRSSPALSGWGLLKEEPQNVTGCGAMTGQSWKRSIRSVAP